MILVAYEVFFLKIFAIGARQHRNRGYRPNLVGTTAPNPTWVIDTNRVSDQKLSHSLPPLPQQKIYLYT